jgi:hypothetical protein
MTERTMTALTTIYVIGVVHGLTQDGVIAPTNGHRFVLADDGVAVFRLLQHTGWTASSADVRAIMRAIQGEGTDVCDDVVAVVTEACSSGGDA